MPSLSPESKVAYLPAGEMGTALAVKGRANSFHGTIWHHSKEAQRHFDTLHESRRLRGIKLDRIDGTHHIGEAIEGAQAVFIASRSEHFEEVIDAARPYIEDGALLVSATKGFVEVDGKFYTPTQIIAQQVSHARERTAFLAGPNFARQIAEGKLSGTTVVSYNLDTAEDVKTIIHNDDLFRVDIHQGDPVPAEAVSAYKNVVGLIMGFAQTLPEYGENTGALILQKGLAEAVTLCTVLGGDPKAVMELYGVGDYGLLMNSITSRNVRAGIAFGRGKKNLEELLHSDITIEGVRTVRAIRKLAREHGIYLPLALTVYRVLYTGRQPADAMDLVRSLLRRNP